MTTGFFYDNQGNLTREEAPDGTSTFGYDALNRQIQAVTKDGNTLVNRYDAFGMFLENRETIPNRITYAGQQYDSLTGQYYLRARYYNPVIGRFTQEDPFRGDGLNLYAYVSNNPVSYYDPTGYSKCSTSGESGDNRYPWGNDDAPSIEWLITQNMVRRTVEMTEWAIAQAKEQLIAQMRANPKTYIYGDEIEEGPYRGWELSQGFNDTSRKGGYRGHYGMDLTPNGNSYDPMKVLQTEGQLILDSKKEIKE